jgi:ABC-2 type transport system permease protein
MAVLRIAGQLLRERRRSLIGWTAGVGLLMVLMAAVYPSVRDSGDIFEEYMEQLPEAMVEAFGLAGASITSPEGYLVSQLYSNIYVIILLVLGLGLGAWAIAGSESDGTLEVALANPVRRVAVALGRVLGIGVALVAVNAVGHIVLAAYAPVVGLDDGLPGWAFGAAFAVSLAFVAVHVALTYAVGAATGRKGWAIGAGAGLALVGFLVNAMAGVAEVFETARDFSPWYWMLRENLLTTAPSALSLWLPLGVTVLLVAAGTWAFNRRDLSGG